MTRLVTVTALQGALAAEHVAVFGYGVIGARLTAAQRDDAALLWNAHRTRRDRLRAYVVANGGRPVAAAAGYRLPFSVDSPRAAARLAATLEDGVTAGYAGLAAVNNGELRRYAALAMQEATVRAIRWRRSPSAAFPGLPETALRPEPQE